MRTIPAKPRAFTLVEILVVVLILGIASAIIIPQIGTRDDLVAAAASRVVITDLIYAQNRAIATQKKHFVQFTAQGYTLLQRDTDASPLVVIQHPLTKNAYTTTFGVASSGLETAGLGTIDFGGGSAVLGFDEMGAPLVYQAASGTANPLLGPATIPVSAGTFALRITVHPHTGEATVQ